MLTSISEARAAGVVPPDAVGEWMFMNKRRDFWQSLKPGIYMFGASQNAGKSYLAFSDEWTKPKDDPYLVLNNGQLPGSSMWSLFGASWGHKALQKESVLVART